MEGEFKKLPSQYFPQMLNNSLWHYGYKPPAKVTLEQLRKAGAKQMNSGMKKQINGFS